MNCAGFRRKAGNRLNVPGDVEHGSSFSVAPYLMRLAQAQFCNMAMSLSGVLREFAGRFGHYGLSDHFEFEPGEGAWRCSP